MHISSSTIKRIVFSLSVVAVGAAAAITYTALLKDGLPEILQPVQPVISQNGEEASKSDINFSPSGTFYGESFSVVLSAKDKNAVIYYTLDGSDPTEKSTKYTKPINISCTSKVKSKTVKAIAVSEDGTSEVITKSYVVCNDIENRFDDGTYVFVLSTDEYNLYDYEYGIAIEGKIRDEWIKNEYDGKSEIIPTDPANWNQEGMAGERPMYVEVFDNNGNLLISQLAGARVSGAYSASVSQKSWKLIARTEYTPNKGKFSYPFFDDAVDIDGNILTKIDRIVLRNGANDREFAGVRDELSMELAKQSGFLDTQSTAPAAVFLNGEYYGFAWLHQNFSNSYLEERYGGNKENYQIIGKAEGNVDEENADGAADDYNKMLELCESGLTSNEAFNEFCSMVDVDNYLRYLALQLFIDNRDWPGNNYKAWRYVASEGEEITSEYHDGKWRYLFYDAEFAWGLYSDGYKNRTLTKILNGTHPSGGSVIAKALLEREDMRCQLANNICDLIGGAFSAENILEVLEEKLEESDKEQMYALNLGITSTWANEETFENSRNEIRDFAWGRADVILSDIKNVFELDDDFYTVNVTGAKGLKVTLNTQTAMDDDTLTADYFTAYPVKLFAQGLSGYEFASFEINGKQYTDSEIILDSSMAQNGVINVKVSAEKTVADEILHISEIYTGGNADWIELYNPNDTAVSTKGLFLTDDEAMLNRWKIPAVTIKPHETVTVVCKNNKDESSLLKLQANFSLKTGETLILSDENSNIIAKAAIIECNKDESLIRQSDGSYRKGRPTPQENS